MTKNEAIACAKAFRPCEVDDVLLGHLLSELEGRIAQELLDGAEWSDITQALNVPEPWSRLYWTYLVAMIDLIEGDVVRCEQSAALFRNAYDAYARHCQRNRHKA